MKIVLFGATGMIGQGALRECLLAPDVDQVLSIGRSATGQSHPKLREIVHRDLLDLGPIADDLRDVDGCLFCLGVSSAGMSEADYSRVTYDYAMAAARALHDQSANLVFVFVSGVGTDSSERGRTMWARVKGKTENALMAMPLRAAVMVRPGYIQPMHGIVSRTGLYRGMYAVMSPAFPLIKRLAGGHVTTTEELGRSMLQAVRNGGPTGILEGPAIGALVA